jgi:hypothetical protein
MGASSRYGLAVVAAATLAGFSSSHAAAHPTRPVVRAARAASGAGTVSLRVQSFHAPGEISCEMDDRPGIIGVFCQTNHTTDNRTARVDADGTVIGCFVHGSGDTGGRCDLGNVGEGTPTFRIGQQATVGPFRCAVLATGVQCTVIASREGFLLAAHSLTAVGGAGIDNAPYRLSDFLSPGRKVWCVISAAPLGAFCAASGPTSQSQHSAQLQRNGNVTFCSVAQATLANVCFQNWDSRAQVLRLGQQSELYGILCTSARHGITCVLQRPSRHAGTGFRVNATSSSRIVGCLPCARLTRASSA